jgi:hypothetical protein
VEQRGIEGAIVECGVWRGGSMMAAALSLSRLRGRRDLYLFDTFAGMTAPEEGDVDWEGRPARPMLDADVSGQGVRAVAHLEEVRRNLGATGYPAERVHYVVGDVVDTLPALAPERIALLRLDTDWFASTYHELAHLYPRLTPGGILIVDDYGHWQGARWAVDRYLSERGVSAKLHPIDYTGRLLIKEA